MYMKADVKLEQLPKLIFLSKKYNMSANQDTQVLAYVSKAEMEIIREFRSNNIVEWVESPKNYPVYLSAATKQQLNWTSEDSRIVRLTDLHNIVWIPSENRVVQLSEYEMNCIDWDIMDGPAVALSDIEATNMINMLLKIYDNDLSADEINALLD